MIYQNGNTKARILIINDDRLSRKALYEFLCRSGYTVDIAEPASEALSYLEENPCDIMLVDVNDEDSVRLLETIKGRAFPAAVIALASYGNIETAINCIKMGVSDYLIRPIEDKKITRAIEQAISKKQPAPSQVIPSKQASCKDGTYYGLVGNCDKIREIYSMVDRIANSRATVLLRGESGTGKRMVARAVHKADRKRHDKPFVEMSCGALPREIIESELFGHTKGAFTGAINDRKGRFELADGGTILLDDIDSFSLDLQVKLLRVLQEKEFERVGDHKTMKVDVRIIASTNQDLEKSVAEKKFREDLYYRLNVISVHIPPLRERKEDLFGLVNYFFDMYSKENQKKAKGLSHEIIDVFKGYDWPGNIRELENIIERAVILDTDGIIGKDDLPDIILNNNRPSHARSLPATLKDALMAPEKVHILNILKEVGWNKKKAALKLGVNRTTLYTKLRKYNLISSQGSGK